MNNEVWSDESNCKRNNAIMPTMRAKSKKPTRGAADVYERITLRQVESNSLEI